jgi:8-oxo-dGTP diphosphatase
MSHAHEMALPRNDVAAGTATQSHTSVAPTPAPRTHYVMGFGLLESPRRVVLIEKRKGPAYVVGKWNGVGGKVERGERIEQAMAREFEEEAGIETAPDSWRFFCELEAPDFHVSCLVGTLAPHVTPRTIEHETIAVWPLDALPDALVPNLRWLLPMALDMTETGRGVVASARDAGLLATLTEASARRDDERPVAAGSTGSVSPASLRIGDDPFGRGERTLFYGDGLYMWLKLIPGYDEPVNADCDHREER